MCSSIYSVFLCDLGRQSLINIRGGSTAVNQKRFTLSQEDLTMDYPTHQLWLIQVVAQAYVHHIALGRMINAYSDTSTDTRKLETQAARLKTLITWFANDTIQECREAYDGNGHIAENHLADLKGDVAILPLLKGIIPY